MWLASCSEYETRIKAIYSVAWLAAVVKVSCEQEVPNVVRRIQGT